MSKWEKNAKNIKLTHIIKQFWWKELDDKSLLATQKKIKNLKYENFKLKKNQKFQFSKNKNKHKWGIINMMY
jgi:hypothetical protein